MVKSRTNLEKHFAEIDKEIRKKKVHFSRQEALQDDLYDTT